MMTEKIFKAIWYTKDSSNYFYLILLISISLLPLSLIFFLLIHIRSLLYKFGLKKVYKSSIPVVIIGNYLVGGQGKTPLTIMLSKYLIDKGMTVGIVSSGYKSQIKMPHKVNKDSDPYLVGDEAVMLAQMTDALIVSGSSRVNATKMLERDNVDLIIHDDGLEHLALSRDFEFIVEKNQVLANTVSDKFKFCSLLPSGPWRRPKFWREGANKRLHVSLKYEYENVFNPASKTLSSLKDFENKTVRLVTGIAFPEIIQSGLEQKNIFVRSTIYDDHHSFSESDIIFNDSLPIFVTMKDYVKLDKFDIKNVWVIQPIPILSESLDILFKNIIDLTKDENKGNYSS